MPNLFEVTAKIALDTSEYERGLDKAGKQTSSFGDKLKSGLVNASKVAVAAVGTLSVAAVGATAKMAKAAMDAYGDYQQLQGGIETLFGSAAESVAENAKQAFETAGMSINEYYETSIQSAAALIKSLGDDRQKAADLMNMSIIDMADNVNKMGTTMEAVQNAYRGFSRGNFTMLDNLALGFAGTKQGMEELLEAAKNLSGVEYDINSYADIVEAIHVVQTEYGITGTTAKEASETLTGSLSAVRAAWRNLITGVANPTANLNELISNLVGTVKTALKNIMPILKQSLSGIAELIKEIAPVIADELPGLIEEVVPIFIESANSVVTALVNALPKMMDSIIKIAPKLIKSFVDTVTKLLPQIVALGLELVITLAEGIADNIDEIVPSIVDTILKIVEILTNPQSISRIVGAATKIIVALANGLIQAIPKIVDQLPKIITGIVDGLFEPDNINAIINAGINLFVSLVQNIPAIIKGICDSIPRIIEGVIGGLLGIDTKTSFSNAGVELAGEIFSDKDKINDKMSSAGVRMAGQVFSDKDGIKSEAESGGGLIANALVSGLETYDTVVAGAGRKAGEEFRQGFLEWIQQPFTKGKNLINWLFTGEWNPGGNETVDYTKGRHLQEVGPYRDANGDWHPGGNYWVSDGERVVIDNGYWSVVSDDPRYGREKVSQGIAKPVTEAGKKRYAEAQELFETYGRPYHKWPSLNNPLQVNVNAEIDGYVLAQAVGTIDNDERRMW